MKKRLLALALALILTLGLFSVTALADGSTVPADTSWYSADGTTFELSDAADLLGLAKLVNDGTTTFAGKAVKLGANIDLTGIDWIPIGKLDASVDFKGDFDGNGKTISNLTMNLGDKGSEKVRAGLFASLVAKVFDLTLTNVTISANGTNVRAGALAANIWTDAQVENVIVSNVNISGTGELDAGGLAGYIYSNNGAQTRKQFVKNVTVDGFTFNGSGKVNVGGLCGYCKDGGASGQGKLQDIEVKNVDLTLTSGYGNIGGVSGANGGYFNVTNVDASDITITANVTKNNSSTTDPDYAGIGGFFGGDSVDGAYDYRDCHVSGLSITLIGDTAAYVGGFGGNAMGGKCWPDADGSNIIGCSAQGTITNNNTATGTMIGGYYAKADGGARQFKNVTADTDISSEVGIVGGFVGETRYWYSNTQTYIDCTATGDVSGAEETTGGFTGESLGNDVYQSSSAAGKVNGDTNGALIGSGNATTAQNLAVLTLDPNDGSATTRIAQTTGGTVDLSTHTPSRSGYRFAGWFTDTNCTVQSVDTVTLTQNLTLYAKWEKIDDFAWLLPVLGALDKEPFDDVTTRDWFYDDVHYVNDYELMTGTGYRLFSPDAPVTRGMVMTILARREGIKTDRYSPWYAAGVEWAVANGISDGTNPEAPITREELATMLYRYAKLKGYDLSGASLTSFHDANSVSNYAVSAMQWAVGSGLINGAAGVNAGKLLPQSTATRAQLAAILHRFFG